MISTPPFRVILGAPPPAHHRRYGMQNVLLGHGSRVILLHAEINVSCMTYEQRGNFSH